MSEFKTKFLLASTAVVMLFGGIALAADNYRTSAPGGVPNTFRSTDIGSGVQVPQIGLTSPGTPITASSANVANASAVATLAGVAAKTTHICGFTITAGGATAAALVTATVAGVITGTMNYTYGAPAGVAVQATPLNVTFVPCVPASAVNTPIVVTLPALGAGNTNATVNARGYQQ